METAPGYSISIKVKSQNRPVHHLHKGQNTQSKARASCARGQLHSLVPPHCTG